MPELYGKNVMPIIIHGETGCHHMHSDCLSPTFFVDHEVLSLTGAGTRPQMLDVRGWDR